MNKKPSRLTVLAMLTTAKAQRLSAVEAVTVQTAAPACG